MSNEWNCKNKGGPRECTYSKSMHQEYPRKCVYCGAPEYEKEPATDVGLISWDKPKKIMSTEAHNNYYSSDSGIAGTYISNMSKEDRLKWKGKKIIKSDNPRIEIRKEIGGANVLIIISKSNPNCTISTNGKITMSLKEMDELYDVVNEANELLIKETNGKEIYSGRN